MTRAFPIYQVVMDHFIYEAAAERAMFGKTPVPPRVASKKCSAQFIIFTDPVPDVFGDGDHLYALAIITRGALGGNSEHTIGVYATDLRGELLEQDDRWISLIDEVATSDPGFGIAEALAAFGVSYHDEY
jgi:hypothetical protein